ncbi:ABC transporter substrate-binding protein [Nitratireductor basaltis]|uniref:Putative Spermidine/putrescine-binding periplasmic protein n=1 Tax=Nitratireductor basaltis TaxID=472175 RepID=A0A084UDY4_9HYPH|nr:extracellular solute-binding protein [Nitratireductor basaltis]KFB11170.1 putative Spermidine/putrescine-binding periplasmic protein [Nitratireductor basaltis]
MKKLITNRRTFIKSSAAGAAILAAPAYLRSTAARASGTVNVWTYANFIPDDFKAEFEKETGIQVNVRLVDDQGKQFNLLAAEAPNPTADIVTVAGHRFLQFIESDLLSPLDTDRLSNWGNINPIYSESDWSTINGNKWGAPILSGAEVLAYNTEVVSEDEVKSWDVMFADKYKGQTAYIIQDMMSVMMLYLGYDGNMVEYKDDPEKAAQIVKETRDLLIENKDMVRKFYDSGAEVQQMFVNQDIVLAHAWNGPIASLIADGFPVAMTIPKEGSYGFVYTLNVTNNGPNTDNAYKLLDALLAKPEIGAQMTKASGFISTYKGADQHLTELERKASSFTEEELAGLQFFRAEANDMKYKLLDPAVEEIKAA